MSKYVDIEPLIQYVAERAYCSFRYPTEMPPKELTEREVWEFVLKYLDFVSKDPVSDVAEVKHGQWIYIRDEGTNAVYECSECQHFNIHAKSLKVPYCWFCGAKMDEGAQNDQ